MTSLTCTSRQARTHRLQWMHASRLTRIAGWARVGGATAGRHGNRLSVTSMRSAHCHSLRIVLVRDLARRLIGDEHLHHHAPRGLRALGGGVYHHARRYARRWHEAASTRSPSTSTMHARQLPSAR